MEFVSSKELSTCIVYGKSDPEKVITSYVILNGEKTNTIISGLILEKCIHVYNYYLVFMTYDCPFEKSLTVSLLDKNGKLLEKKDIFAAYYTDDFSDLQLYEPNIVTFDFLYKGLWKIEIFPTAKELTLLKSFGFIFRKRIKTKAYWKVSLDLERQTRTLSFILKKLAIILLCCCGLLYLFGYF